MAINNSFMVSTSILNIKLHSIKLLNKWYLSLDRFQHFNPSTNILCQKGCNRKANYIHFWWQCSVIQKFWHTIATVIKEITGYGLPFNPGCFLLNNWQDKQWLFYWQQPKWKLQQFGKAFVSLQLKDGLKDYGIVLFYIKLRTVY